MKLVPGAEPAQIERLTALASRVSINLEAPCGASLAQIAPEKSLPVALDEPRAGARHGARASGAARRRRPRGRAAPRRRRGHDDAVRRRGDAGHRPHPDRHGGAGSTPAAASTTRTSAPSGRSCDTPMENVAGRARRCGSTGSIRRTICSATTASTPTRSCTRHGNLPLAVDPKAAWALAHPERFPVEVTRGLLRGAGAGAGRRPRLGAPAGGGAAPA